MINPSTSARNWFVFGSEMAPAAPVALRAGPLQLWYDPANGFLRWVSWGEQELVRCIYGAVRDRNWGTVPGRIRSIRQEVGPDRFDLEFESEHRQEEVHFTWQGAICGRPDGSVSYEFNGEARRAFLRNRIGICLLHPSRGCADVRARQRRRDGTVLDGSFPQTVEPQIVGKSPFRDLGKVAHAIAPGRWTEIEFEGDVFEMEDQRNWTDASFKTYSTPLALPFPVEIQAGTRIRQKVTLRLAMEEPLTAESKIELVGQPPDVVTVTIAEPATALVPQIGLGTASHTETLDDFAGARLRALRLGHLRVDVRLTSPDWPARWERAVQEVELLGARIELALHLPREGEGDLRAFQQLLRVRPARLVRVLACRQGEAATTLETLRMVRRAVGVLDLPVGAGSDANFCEVNREQTLGRLAISEADFVFWPINPQVHLVDHLSVMENLEGQADTVTRARTFAGGKPLIISPVTLKPRIHALTTTPVLADAAEPLPSSVDARQLSLFAASWTLGCLSTLAAAGVESVTLYETTGWGGVMERPSGSASPSQFPSLPGALFPVYHLLADCAGYDRHAPAQVSSPGRIADLTLFDPAGRRRVLLSNLEAQVQRVRLRTSASRVQVCALATEAVLTGTTEPGCFWAEANPPQKTHDGILELELPPYGLGRVDWIDGGLGTCR